MHTPEKEPPPPAAATPDAGAAGAGHAARPAPRVSFSAPSPDWLMVILLQRWRWVLGLALAAALGVLVALPFLTRQYEISASLLYKLGREQAPPTVTGAAAVAAPFRRTEDVTSEAEIIASQALVEDLVRSFGVEYFTARKPPQTPWEHVKDFARSLVRGVRDGITELMILAGLEKRLTPFERVVATLVATIKVEAVKRADVVEVKLLMPDAQAGIDVMNKLIELYLAEHIRAFQTPGATRFLDQRAQVLRGELAALEAKRRSFGQGAALWDLDEQRRSLLLQQRELRQAMARTVEDLGRAEAEVEHAAALLATPPPEQRVSRVQQSNPVLQQLQLRVVEQRAKLDRLRLVYGDDSRRLADEQAELANLERLRDAQAASVLQSETYEPGAGVREAERGLVARRSLLAGLQAQLQRQREQDRRISDELQRLDGLGEESRRLARELALAEQNYQLVARRLEEARIADALDAAAISNVSLIGRPTASVNPVRPRAKLLFLAALAGGLVGGFGFFVLRDALRPTVHSRERVAEALGAPVLLRLPEVRR